MALRVKLSENLQHRIEKARRGRSRDMATETTDCFHIIFIYCELSFEIFKNNSFPDICIIQKIHLIEVSALR